MFSLAVPNPIFCVLKEENWYHVSCGPGNVIQRPLTLIHSFLNNWGHNNINIAIRTLFLMLHVKYTLVFHHVSRAKPFYCRYSSFSVIIHKT